MAHAQVDPNRTVIVVNGVEIKGNEYYRKMEYLPGVGKMVGNSFAQFPPGFLAIEQLITEQLIAQLSKEKGVYPSDQEIKDEIDFALKNEPDALKEWTDSGQTEEEFRRMSTMNLCNYKLLTRGINITDQEVDQFYKTNPALFTIPKMVSLRVIAVQTAEQAAQVDVDIDSGKDFAEVAKARSLDFSAQSGGDFGKRALSDLSPQAQTALNNVKVGGTTAWIIGGTTRVKFKLEAVEPEVLKKLDDLLKKRIRRELSLTKGNVKNAETLRNEMKEMRKKANIDIKQKEFAEFYRQFSESFIKPGG